MTTPTKSSPEKKLFGHAIATWQRDEARILHHCQGNSTYPDKGLFQKTVIWTVRPQKIPTGNLGVRAARVRKNHSDYQLSGIESISLPVVSSGRRRRWPCNIFLLPGTCCKKSNTPKTKTAPASNSGISPRSSNLYAALFWKPFPSPQSTIVSCFWQLPGSAARISFSWSDSSRAFQYS